jgi:hypothetical protein
MSASTTKVVANTEMQRLCLDRPYYGHRANADGTLESICPHCFVTIGKSVWEAELERMESLHSCAPDSIHHFKSRIDRLYAFKDFDPPVIVPIRRSA